MRAEPRLPVCQNLEQEVRAILERDNFPGSQLVVLPARCHQTGGHSAVAPQTESRASRGPRPLPLIGCHRCEPGEGGDRPQPLCAPGTQCYDLLIGREFAAAIQRQGSYLITPGWLDRWPDYIRYWGFDQTTAQRFFSESMQRLVLLDTGVNPKSGDQLRAFSTFVGLPAEVLPVGLDHLRLVLKMVFEERRREEQEVAARASVADLQRKLGDYAMIYDLMGRLAAVRSETEAVAAIFELFTMLVAPARMCFLPVVDGKAGALVAQPPGQEAEDAVQTRLLALPGESVWRESAGGFDLRLGAGDDTVGLIAVERILLPQHGPHYLNLALNVSQVCSLAIRNARNYDKLGQNIAELQRSMTERKQAEAEREKLEAQNRQLQKSESLGRMAAAIAHHFNNQLQVVMLNLEIAASNLPRQTAPMEGVAEAMQAARKAAEVSTMMLTYLGQTWSRQEPLNLAEVCRQSLPLLQAALPRSVVWETEFATPGPDVTGNRNQLQHAVTILVTNAWEASGDRPNTVRLAVKTVAAAEIPAAHRLPLDFVPQELAYACIAVSDTGCGIPAENHDKIFDPFFSTKFAGRGMGLPVVLGIARAHHGAVTVASEPGQGSVFRLFLPLAPEAVPARPVPVTPPPSAARVRALLVVEDEPAVRRGFALALRHAGIRVFEAEDGVAAMEVFRQHQDEIQCVLCDVTMPRMDGWDTLAALRKLVPGLPVILASGHSEAQVMEGSHSDQPQVLLHKPFDVSTLFQAINQALAKRGG